MNNDQLLKDIKDWQMMADVTTSGGEAINRMNEARTLLLRASESLKTP